jgi:hypothetical protein
MIGNNIKFSLQILVEILKISSRKPNTSFGDEIGGVTDAPFPIIRPFMHFVQSIWFVIDIKGYYCNNN